MRREVGREGEGKEGKEERGGEGRREGRRIPCCRRELRRWSLIFLLGLFGRLMGPSSQSMDIRH